VSPAPPSCRRDLLSAPKLLLPQAAREIGTSVSSLRRWITTGVRGVILPAVHIGGKRYILRDDLARFLEQIQEEVSRGLGHATGGRPARRRSPATPRGCPSPQDAGRAGA
jgi:hypothetical protein